MNSNMSARDLFKKIINFESCERTLNWEFGYWAGTIENWYKEGLTKIKGLPENLTVAEDVLGPALPASPPPYGKPFLRDYDVSNFFNFDEGFGSVPYDYWIFPRFERKIIFEDDRVIELYDFDGIRKRTLKDGTSMPFWIDYPIKDKHDWEKLKEERFNFNTITKRYTVDIKEYSRESGKRTYPLAMLGGRVGFFGSIRFLLGEKNLYFAYYDNPGLIKEILGYLCDFWIAVSEELISKIDFDVVVFWEDMSGKNGSLISPITFREFMTPNYKRIISFLKSKGFKKFIVDTDGDVNKLIPLFIEAGVNGMYPFEQQAGNDIIKLRKEFPDLIMSGGFDKNTLYMDKSAIDKELEKMKWMISQGGFIPYADHLVPPNSIWENFKYYREKLRDIIYSTRITV
jgi:uroporphyrinogen-III decarboxylase